MGQIQITALSWDEKLPENQSYFEEYFPDSLSFEKWFSLRKNKLNSFGFVMAKIEFAKSDSVWIGNWNFGKPYKFKISEIEERDLLLANTYFLNQNRPLSKQNIQKTLLQLLEPYQNNGYPFAYAEIQPLKFSNGFLDAKAILYAGPFVAFDSIQIKGFEDFPEGFVKHGLNLKQGEPYSEEKLREVGKNANQIPFFRTSRDPQVGFSKNKNTVYLYLEKQSANIFDGIVGLNTDNTGNVTLNGNIDLLLTNTFKGGETIKLEWRSPEPKAQQLESAVEIPYLFKTPLWMGLGFQLTNQDSTFSSRIFDFSLKYQIQSKGFLNLGYQFANNFLLPYGQSLSEFGTTEKNQLSLGFNWRNVEGVIPRKGYYINTQLGYGNRNSEGLNYDLYEVKLKLAYLPQLKGNHFGFVLGEVLGVSSEQLFQNELFRFGGLKSLRGFNEQTIFGNLMLKNTIEYRFFFEESSFLFLFSDLAYIENPSPTIPANTFWGVGTGLTLRTRGGIFSIAYALGRTRDANFDLRTGKIHFGYTNTF